MVRGPSPTIQIFNKYVKRDEDGVIDASGIFTKPCYLEWLAIRKTFPKDPEHAFRKAVTGHCRGDCGLKPFAPDIEVAVLNILRRKQVWSCFKDSKVKIGSRGFQTQGYWEMRKRTNKRQRYEEDSVAGSISEEEEEEDKVQEKPVKRHKSNVARAKSRSAYKIPPEYERSQSMPLVYGQVTNPLQTLLLGGHLGTYFEPNPLLAQQMLAQQYAWQQYAFNSLLYQQLN